ncbi:MAG: PilZ domain-containing protein [Nitrospirota bacterium]
MDVVMLFLPELGSLVQVFGSRRCARRVVRIPTTVANKSGLTRCVVTNISEAGCELQLVTPFVFSHYLTLKIYPQDGATPLLITLGENRWVEKEWAGVKFVNLSQADKAKLTRLCSEQDTLALGE